MKLEKFVIMCLEREATFVRTLKGWDAIEYHRLADLTKYVSYDCDFDKSGVCKDYRKKRAPCRSGSDKTMCCCNNCASTIGYLMEIDHNLHIVTKYAELYNKKTGFWKKGVGCTLPRSMRAPICLTYNCSSPAAESLATRALFVCLGGKKGSMLGCNYQYQVVDKLEAMFKEERK